MAQDKAAMNERLRQLQNGFLERTEMEISELEDLCSGGSVDSVEGLAGIERIAHRIAGGGGTFGFPELSTAAEDLERAAEKAQNEDSEPDEDLSSLVAELRRVHREQSGK